MPAAICSSYFCAVAKSDKRAVLTFNRQHFFRLHRHRPGHCGIVACTYDPDFGALAERIDAALTNTPELDGQLIRINRPQGFLGHEPRDE